jgi:chlorite dismutase
LRQQEHPYARTDAYSGSDIDPDSDPETYIYAYPNTRADIDTYANSYA